MQTSKRTFGKHRGRLAFYLSIGILALQALSATSFADVIEMVNGDQYKGAVLSVTLTNVTVRSEIQGTITLPRPKVARITFGAAAGGSPVSAASGPSQVQPPRTLAPRDLAEALKPKGADTNFVARLQSDLLRQAGPEAARKYSELANGLLSGSIGINDLRKQAEQTLRDAEAMKQELGPEAGEMLDGYLQILRNFLNESGGSPGGSAAKP